MAKFKLGSWNKFEIIAYFVIIAFIIARAIFHGDYYVAVISAVCGITYTVLAGKGVPLCNVIGVVGSGFYGFLAFQNAIWGNLLLYVCYYIPMQILAFFKWNKHLKQEERVIIKTSLSKKELSITSLVTFLLILAVIFVLYKTNASHPILDGITTVVSITGMYLAVRRMIEQWCAWMIVNSLSLFMWLRVALSGQRVWSTVIMWGVYLFLAFYFYYKWRKELELQR